MRLWPDAHAGGSKTHLAMVTRAAFDVERTGFSRGAIGVKRIAVRLLIVLVARKLTAHAHANDVPARFDAFTARRAIGIERTRHALHAGKRQCQGSSRIFCPKLLHAIPGIFDPCQPIVATVSDQSGRTVAALKTPLNLEYFCIATCSHAFWAITQSSARSLRSAALLNKHDMSLTPMIISFQQESSGGTEIRSIQGGDDAELFSLVSDCAWAVRGGNCLVHLAFRCRGSDRPRCEPRIHVQDQGSLTRTAAPKWRKRPPTDPKHLIPPFSRHGLGVLAVPNRRFGRRVSKISSAK